jgi:DNA modification methylase
MKVWDKDNPLKFEDMINQVICGDCLEVMKHIPEKSVDLVLTDPPYNVGLDYDGYNDKNENYYQECDLWFSECRRISDLVVFTPGIINLNFWAKKCPTWVICWFKPNQCSHQPLNGFNVWEPVLVFGKPKVPVGQDGFNIPISGKDECEAHPCPKSQKAWTKLLLMISREGDLVLDPMHGSGTTALTCKKNGRRFIGIDQSKKYVEIAERRLSQEYLFT